MKQFLPYKWTEQELEILKSLYGVVSDEEIARVLKNRTPMAITKKATDLKLACYNPDIDLDYYKKLMEMKRG